MEYRVTLLHIIFSCEQDRPVIHVFDGRGEDKEIAYLDKLHSSPITFMEVCIFVKLLRNQISPFLSLSPSLPPSLPLSLSLPLPPSLLSITIIMMW